VERNHATFPKAENQVQPPRPARQEHAHRVAQCPGNQAAQVALGATIQAKLTVNRPGDPFEQEADRMAALVVSGTETDAVEERPGVAAARGLKLQRKCAACQEEEKSGPAIQLKCSACSQADGGADVNPEVATRIQSLRGGGQALPESARNFFEPRFGADFSNVRVHTDPVSTRNLGARAYTMGRDIVFGAGQYSTQTETGKKLLAHELTHVVQQGAAKSQVQTSTSETIQRAGDPAFIPPAFPCPTDLTPGTPAGTDILFEVNQTGITPVHTSQLTAFRDAWVADGGTDDILVHGYASTDGPQGPNWTLSCDRAEAVRTELVRLGIPRVRINVVAHGESTDFGAPLSRNRHAVVSTSEAGFIQLPLVTGTLTARDNFPGRSQVRFGVGETIDLNFLSFPPASAADFGGLEWFITSGAGVLVQPIPPDGTGTFTAPPLGGAVTLELRVAGGATAGRVISTHPITIVAPIGVRMVGIPGTFPFTSPTPAATPIPAGTAGAGMLANVFADPRDVSYLGVVFGEATVPVVTTGTFFAGAGPHPANTFGAARAGNAATGSQISPPPDQAATQRAPTGALLGLPTCGGPGGSTFLWAIPWEFSVAGGPRTRMVRRANQVFTASFFCNVTVSKAGAGPFCRRINGTVC